MLEELLYGLNGDLQPSEKKLVEKYAGQTMSQPLILVMGPLRSGTTLFTQWLANTGLFAYPTNLLSRFYQAPILGAKIQLLLTDPRFNFRDELGEFVQQAEYKSENGKTKGVLAPNEFWYFWRRFLADPTRDVWLNDELKQSMDVQTMKAELVGMMDVFQKPFAAKGMLFNYNIPFLDTVLDKAIFVQIKRDPLMNIQSVLGARERQLGSCEAWYSFEIPEKQELMKLSAIEQAAGQVASINKAVEEGLQGVAEDRKLVVQYEDFCASPEHYFNKLMSCMYQQGVKIEANYLGRTQFSCKNNFHMSECEASLAKNIYRKIFMG
ncbi:sulfotransferase [methane-oxidizing endosymbiont of Gigantopelta aegis]|uniref:sulfotransferase n=1 Tax=methane-oxidizing endosymbiont of Gigantopelta aegis TaxID=2794938 RepID=UPI001FD92C99|nr:sulfotransferase [methane-oxidizing endosymbiont of Gigantopelta aegis]